MRGASDAMLLLSAAILAIAALRHGDGALGGRSVLVRAVPEVGGGALFVPGRAATAIAGLVIASVAVLYGTTPQKTALPLLISTTVAPLLALSGVVFIVRAVGGFNHVGFFNRGGITPFAVADRKVYSPLCLVLGVSGLHAAGLRLL